MSFRPASGTIRPIRSENTIFSSRDSSTECVSLKMDTLGNGEYLCPFSNLEDLWALKKAIKGQNSNEFRKKTMIFIQNIISLMKFPE